MTFEELLTNPKIKVALQSDIPTPLYHQIYLFLKEKIISGELAYGDKMPTENDLSEAFGVSRITAKRAMTELAEEGFVSRQRGKGSHVKYKHRAKKVPVPMGGLLESLKILGRQSQVQSLLFHPAIPPADIRKRFNIKATDALIHSKRIRLSDGIPFGYYGSWTRDIGDCYTPHAMEQTSRIEIFKQAGIALGKIQQHVTATVSNVETAMHLDIGVGKPLLVINRSIFDKNGDLFDYLYAYYRPDQYQFEMEFSVD